MCWFFKRKTEKTEIKAEKHDRSHADEIRKYARAAYITPARKKGLKHASFSAEEIQSVLKQGIRLQSIVSAIDAAKFCEFARVKRVKRTEKKGNSAVRWTFEL
jgi:hypothetical protein